MDTILNKPYRHRVATDRLNRVYSQLVSFLEGKSGLTPAGKTTLPRIHAPKPDFVGRRDEKSVTSFGFSPFKLVYTVANSASGLLNREKRTNLLTTFSPA